MGRADRGQRGQQKTLDCTPARRQSIIAEGLSEKTSDEDVRRSRDREIADGRAGAPRSLPRRRLSPIGEGSPFGGVCRCQLFAVSSHAVSFLARGLWAGPLRFASRDIRHLHRRHPLLAPWRDRRRAPAPRGLEREPSPSALTRRVANGWATFPTTSSMTIRSPWRPKVAPKVAPRAQRSTRSPQGRRSAAPAKYPVPSTVAGTGEPRRDRDESSVEGGNGGVRQHLPVRQSRPARAPIGPR